MKPRRQGWQHSAQLPPRPTAGDAPVAYRSNPALQPPKPYLYGTAENSLGNLSVGGTDRATS